MRSMTNMIRQGVTDSFGVVWFWLDPGDLLLQVHQGSRAVCRTPT